MKFGLSAVTVGVKRSAINDEAVLIANSTKAKFTLSGLVTRQLGLLPGDNIQFISNIDAITSAISEGDAQLVEWLANYNNMNGIDMDIASVDARDIIFKEFAEWAICKGVEAKDKTGMPRMTSIRVSKEDKLKMLELQKEDLVNEMGEVLYERAVAAGKVEAGEECELELLSEMLTIDDVKLPETVAYLGSKTATTSSMVGHGLILNFSDGSVWDELKRDLGESAESLNRYFKLNLNEPTEVEIHNGFETVVVKAYTFKYDVDKAVTPRKKSEDKAASDIATESAE